MPTEPRFTETQLPTELGEVEKQLARFSPVRSTINRDALMYQAGWSAAKAQAQSRPHWLWPATSAVLAASLLILIAFPATPLQRTGTEETNVVKTLAKQTGPQFDPEAKHKIARTSPVPPKRCSPRAPLLVMRERALRQDFDDLPIGAFTDDHPRPPETTNRQLLEELLPGMRTPRSRQRVWSSWNLGETS